ncbi:MAG: hypothetical protein MMC33_006818 [Icmadophila ericetorum]|nr:hypothetical protein [Icmadophila ericetorum]
MPAREFMIPIPNSTKDIRDITLTHCRSSLPNHFNLHWGKARTLAGSLKKHRATTSTTSSKVKSALLFISILLLLNGNEIDQYVDANMTKRMKIILKDVAVSITASIQTLKDIGDIAVNHDPVHSALPWVGVRLLLEVIVVDSRKMGALLTGVERVTYLINRCKIYELLYLREKVSAPKDSPQSLAIANLEDTLIALYAAILTFLSKAGSLYDQKFFASTVHGILNPKEVVNFLKECQILEKRLHGSPGAGKTKLVSTVVDSLSDSTRQSSNVEMLAYFYCDRNQAKRQQPALVGKSDGIFQWASLQIDQILELSREQDIRERLGKLPDDLKSAYDEIYNRIKRKKGSAPLVADRAF